MGVRGCISPSYEWVRNYSHEYTFQNCLSLQIPAELSRQSHTVLGKARALFDLDANPLVIEAALSRDLFLRQLIVRHSVLRVPGCWDNFELLLRVILGQQVSVAGATTTMRRLVDRIGVTPANIAASSPEAIAAIGMPLKRATTIWMLGDMVQSGILHLDERDPQLFYEQLVALPGIGPWTAEYMRMRVLHCPDAFPAGDLGLQKAAMQGQRQTERQLIAHSAAWQPWRSYATILLWKSLENLGG
jgi:AraC family transcriptional regulator, regulatory protein of adaptative response / DNA-3-methyladenine glycosylase II